MIKKSTKKNQDKELRNDQYFPAYQKKYHKNLKDWKVALKFFRLWRKYFHDVRNKVKNP